ncbi:MAG TPA: sensor histidine kinase [Clostridia bacterium]|nr:sensor histidine kinase [Clostridia bacterium]
MRSLRARLIVFFFLILFFSSSIIAIASYVLFRHIMINEIGNSRVDTLKQISERVQVLKDSAMTIANLYYQDTLVYGTMISDDISSMNLPDIKYNLISLYTKYFQAFEQINAPFYIVLISENGFRFCTLSDSTYNFDKIKSMSWHAKNAALGNDSYLVSSFNDFDSRGNNKFVFSAVKTFRKTNNSKYAGTLMVNVLQSSLYNTYANVLNQHNSIYIVDDLARIISHRDENLLGTNPFPMNEYGFIYGAKNYEISMKDNKKILFSKYYSPETKWTIIEEISLSSLLAPLNNIRNSIILIYIVSCIASLILSIYFAHSISKPLNTFCLSINKTSQGDLNVISDINSYSEIEQISDSFNEMTVQLKKLLTDVKTKEQQIRKTELDFLQAQINPHFLYNTLFSIKCMIAINKSIEAIDMTSILINLLKSSLGTREQFITIESEINYIKQYIELQKLRYSNSLKTRISIDQKLMKYKIPRIILQPIIENAIFHGIEPNGGCGLISISVEACNDDIQITVDDDGVGMDEKKLSMLLCENQIPSEENHTKIGLINIHQRIQLNFGKAYGLKIKSAPQQGTSISILLPKIL